MFAKTAVHPFLIVWSKFIEFIFKPFIRRHRSTPPQQEAETSPQFENDPKETVRELEERTPIMEVPDKSEEFMPVFLNDTGNHSPEVRAPKGIALRKSVQFRTNRSLYLTAKVVGYSWEDPSVLLLSRNGGLLFRRRLC